MDRNKEKPKMEVVSVAIDSITADPANVRTHPERNIAGIKASLVRFGQQKPIVVGAAGVVVAGNGTLDAARALGWERIDVVRTDLVGPDAIAYAIADNRTAELAEWDDIALAATLEELQRADPDLVGVAGFSEQEIATLLEDARNHEGLTDPDDVPLPPDEPVTKRGDLWILGNHRLLCGDSGSVEDLDRLLDGASIDLVNMDPPYNVKVEPRSNNAIAAGLSSFTNKNAQLHHQSFDVARAANKKLAKHTVIKADGTKVPSNKHGFDLATGGQSGKPTRKKMRAKDRPLANDFITADSFDEMLDAWFGNASRVLKPGGSFYIWGGYANLGNYPAPLKRAGFYFSQGIIWDKQWPVLNRKDYMCAFEICFYGWKEGAGHHFYGPNNAADLWHVKKITPMQMEHLTAKPAELARLAIEYSSQAGENVLDLFGGSGSTAIACEMTGRHAYLMELDEAYCDVIADRYQRFSGKPAVLERTGESPIAMGARDEAMR